MGSKIYTSAAFTFLGLLLGFSPVWAHGAENTTAKTVSINLTWAYQRSELGPTQNDLFGKEMTAYIGHDNMPSDLEGNFIVTATVFYDSANVQYAYSENPTFLFKYHRDDYPGIIATGPEATQVKQVISRVQGQKAEPFLTSLPMAAIGITQFSKMSKECEYKGVTCLRVQRFASPESAAASPTIYLEDGTN